jgi:DNA modification methylase
VTMECACEHCGHEFDAEPEGGHRLLCGDSTNATDVDRLLEGLKATLCLTDPPYGLGGTVSDKNDYAEYDDSPENLHQLVADFFPLALVHAHQLVLTPGNANQRLYPPPAWTMAWFTPAGVGSGPWGFCCWQPILCYGKDPKLSKGKGRHPDAIVHTETAEKLGHPCAKPIKFWCWLMERASEVGELIYDPFSGAGTSILAAQMTSRTCRAIEITAAYCDVAVNRWSKFTGRTAVLADEWRTFDEVSTARKAA